MTTKAAAPSLIEDAFPAVTLPSFLKAGFKLGSLSKFTRFGSSSSSIHCSGAFRCDTGTETISRLNSPRCCALSARR
jgi:hypothetical protein